jgi:hypothetical protein
MNRREFLQASVVTSLALSSSASAAEPAVVPIYKVICDERFADAVAFGAAAGRSGATVRAIRGDITAIWYNDLYPRWKESPVAIAGLTAHRSLFCLDMFARDFGLRVIHCADHRILTDGSVEHRVFGPEGAFQTALLTGAGKHWAGEAANRVMRFPQARCQPVGKSADPLIPVTAPQPLVSWVIAPVNRT